MTLEQVSYFVAQVKAILLMTNSVNKEALLFWKYLIMMLMSSVLPASTSKEATGCIFVVASMMLMSSVLPASITEEAKGCISSKDEYFCVNLMHRIL